MLLLVHLGMTGKLLLEEAPGAYTRALFALDRGLLCYDDVRMFGRIELAERLPARISRLGPEPLAVSADELYKLLRAHRSQIKPLLLNQSFLRGLGNIYTDEALFRARIHPRAIASHLSRERAARLHQAIVEVLTMAIERGGSSISDYVDAEGRKGWFQFSHQVYQKTGEPCPCCSTPIRRILVAQRGTHYCPKCQRV
jgi:formamidopyrimidine-DNA glycosylase